MDSINQAKSTSETNQDNTEDDVFAIVTKIENLELCESKIVPEWLQNMESPFNWLQERPPDVSSKEIIVKATERQFFEMDEGFAGTFPFEEFVRTVTLAFEFTCIDDQTEAWQNLTLAEELLKTEKDRNDSTFYSISEALIHTFEATKAHILFQNCNVAEAKQVAKGVQPVNEMCVEARAAVNGLRARFFYYYRGAGAHLAVQYAHQALALAPDSTLWQVLTAQSIRRLRRFQPGDEEVSTEEISLLEGAVNKERNIRHLLLLAQAYRELGDSRFKKHRAQPDFFQSQMFHEISDLQEKSFHLYKEALQLEPDSEVVNRLCGYGLLKLPAFKSDYRLAEKCLQKALEQVPDNATTIHSLGLYYYKGLMEYEKAALFCEKAGKLGNFSASLDMLRMKRLVYGRNYDPVFDFRRLLQQYGDDKTKRHEILCQMGSYSLFFERNLSKALRYFKTLIKENAEQSIMTSHKCTFLNMACKINLFQCIVSEGQLILQQNTHIDQEESNSVSEIKLFLEYLKEKNSELFDEPLNPNLIDNLHKVSDDIKQTYIRKKERRDSYKEKNRGSVSSRRSSLDGNISAPRHQSESSINFRRRSSGNVEIFQNRGHRSSNGGNYTQFSSSGNEKEKTTDNKKRNEYKSNGHQCGVGSNGLRRKSSGCISEMAQNRSFRDINSPKQRQQFFENAHISETITESSHETERISQRQSGQNISNEGQNNSSKKRNRKPTLKRHVSWSGNTTNGNQTNWRIKDQKEEL